MKPRPTSPRPPCAQRCWEPIGDGWRYTASVSACGHSWDPRHRRWSWRTAPTAPITTTPHDAPRNTP